MANIKACSLTVWEGGLEMVMYHGVPWQGGESVVEEGQTGG